MFEGAVKENVVCPIVKPTKKYHVFIKTAYSTIEQHFTDRDKAVEFLNMTRSNFEVIGYEIKTYIE